MVITRTPFRISFFGGGTDYPAWYKNNNGSVLSTTIDKYCYLTCRYLPPFFDFTSRIVWSRIEQVTAINDIQHNSVRETIRFLGLQKGVSIHHDGDLPAQSGLGSSSSFTVGLLHALYSLTGKLVSKKQLALDAIDIEQNWIKENVGSQDQVAASYGGLNKIVFNPDGNFSIHPVSLSRERVRELQEHLLLFFTGFSRKADKIAKMQIESIDDKLSELKSMHQSVDESISILYSNNNMEQFGDLLHENWMIKRNLTSVITTPEIDAIYESARKAGATGGKLLGAGGGGFMLIFAPPERHCEIRKRLNKLLYVPFRFEFSGSQVIYYTPEVHY